MINCAVSSSPTETFTMDALGNRTGDQTLRDDGTVSFTVDSGTNRYSPVIVVT